MGSPTIGSIFAHRVVVGVGDMAIANNPELIVSTYALGSCVGVAAYAPRFKIGGILHLMLPEARISPAKAAAQPAMFADTGLPYFFSELNSFRRLAISDLRIFVAGGASVMSGADPFRIGERNRAATLAYLANAGLPVHGQDLGGTVNRTVHLQLSTGELTLKTPLGQRKFSLESV